MKEIQIECPACHGTGLYQGMCEQDGCAVVCTECGGNVNLGIIDNNNMYIELDSVGF